MKQKQTVGTVLALAGLLVALGATPVAAGVFLKIDGIDGEATAEGHENWIVIESVSTTMNVAPGSSVRSADHRRGDAVLGDIMMTRKVDKASPKLSEAVCNGRVFPKVEIHVTATYGGSSASYRYELTDVRVSSYSVSAGGGSGDVPVEEISLNFAEVKVQYDQQGRQGSSKGNVETTWKVEEGEK